MSQASVLVTRILAPNPGPMTLEGTNSYLIRDPRSTSVVVIDPGPADADHRARLGEHGRIELILLTHQHSDHTAGAVALSSQTGAPVRAMDPLLSLGAGSLVDGEEIVAGGTRILVCATPGHTADSVCFFLPDDRPLSSAVGTGTMLTGDTLLGRGSTVITTADGSLADYLNSLSTLAGYQDAVALPGHGPAIADLAAACESQLTHRLRRLDEVERALADLSLPPAVDDATVHRVAEAVYGSPAPRLRGAVEASTRAQLAYLSGRAVPPRNLPLSRLLHPAQGYLTRSGAR